MIVQFIDRLILKLKEFKKQLVKCISSKPQHSHEGTQTPSIL